MENLNLKQNMFGLFSASAVILYGGLILITSRSFDPKTIIYALKNVSILALLFGFLGYGIGKILEKSKLINK